MPEKLTQQQKASRAEIMREEVDELEEQVQERIAELHARGVGVNPLIVMAVKVEILIQWAAPTEYGRARFDLQVAKQVMVQLADEIVDPVVDEQVEMAKVIAEAQALAAEGRTQTGLFIPGTKEVIAANKGTGTPAAPEPLVGPSATPEPAARPAATGGEVRIG